MNVRGAGAAELAPCTVPLSFLITHDLTVVVRHLKTGHASVPSTTVRMISNEYNSPRSKRRTEEHPQDSTNTPAQLVQPLRFHIGEELAKATLRFTTEGRAFVEQGLLNRKGAEGAKEGSMAIDRKDVQS